jgi:hypothetical protein
MFCSPLSSGMILRGCWPVFVDGGILAVESASDLLEVVERVVEVGLDRETFLGRLNFMTEGGFDMVGSLSVHALEASCLIEAEGIRIGGILLSCILDEGVWLHLPLTIRAASSVSH